MTKLLILVLLVSLKGLAIEPNDVLEGPKDTPSNQVPHTEHVVLAPLANQASMAQWQVRSGTELELVKWPDGAPGLCGKLTLKKYEPNGQQWPGIILGKDVLARHDWSFLKKLKIPIYSEKTAMLRLHLLGKDKKFYHTIHVSPGRNTIVIDRSLLLTAPLEHVISMDYFLTRPGQDVVVYLGDMTAEFENPKAIADTFRKMAHHALKADYKGLPPADQAMKDSCLKKLEELAGLNLSDHKILAADNLRSSQTLFAQLTSLEHLAAFLKINPHERFSAAWVSGAEKVYQQSQVFENAPRKSWTFYACGNEREGAQLVIYPLKPMKNTRVTVEWDDMHRNLKAVIAPVCYVWCGQSTIYVAKRTGWIPDPICSYATTLNLEPGNYQPYYLEIQVPKGAKAGNHTGHIRVSADGMQDALLPFAVRTFGFDLPDGAPYPTAVSRGATNLGATFPATPERRRHYHEQCLDMLASHRFAPDNIYRLTPPSVEEAKRICAGPTAIFNIMYIKARKDTKGNYPQKEAETIMKKLAQAIPRYAHAGILNRAYIYACDEAGPDMMKAMRDICGKIKKTYPDIPLMTTAMDDSMGADTGLEHLIDIWVPLSLNMIIHDKATENARKRGKHVWWYVCIAPLAPYANVIIDLNDTIDGRHLMGLMAQKYQPQGFLYYCAAMWRKYTKNKAGQWVCLSMRDKYMEGAPLTDWPGASYHDSNGDGNWIYPGADGPIPSLRLKNMNDGMEDFFYWDMLRNAVNSVENKQASMPDNWLTEAREALQAPGRLIHSMTEFSKDFYELQRERVNAGSLLEQFFKKNRL